MEMLKEQLCQANHATAMTQAAHENAANKLCAEAKATVEEEARLFADAKAKVEDNALKHAFASFGRGQGERGEGCPEADDGSGLCKGGG